MKLSNTILVMTYLAFLKTVNIIMDKDDECRDKNSFYNPQKDELKSTRVHSRENEGFRAINHLFLVLHSRPLKSPCDRGLKRSPIGLQYLRF